MVNILGFIVSFVKAISVEPAAILSSIGVNVYAIAADLGMYRVMCDKFFNVDNGTALNNHQHFECWDTKHPLGYDLPNDSAWWETAEIEIQQRTTTWSMASSLATMLPCMFATVITGAYGDRRGRKGVLLLGMFGMALYGIPLPILFTYPETMPVYICYIVGVIAALTGYYSSAMASMAAYLTDTVKDKEILTVRMAILQICLILGIVIGPLIAAALLNAIPYSWAVVIATGFTVAGLVCAMFNVKQITPRAASEDEKDAKSTKAKVKPIDPEKQDLDKDSEANGKTGCLQEAWVVAKEVPGMLADSFRTVFKEREGHHRAYILVSAYAIFVFSAIDSTFNSSVFELYVQKEPLLWTQDRISYFRSMANLIRLMGTIVGVFIFKNVFHMSDTLIIILAFISMLGQGVLITLSTTSWMLYLAAGVGAFASLSYPCAQAFAAKVLKPDEVGKAYGAFSLTTTVSFVFSSVVAGAIYQATVAFAPTLVFAVCSAILGSALLLSIWLYLDYGGAVNGCLKRMCSCCGPKHVYEVQ